MANDVTLTAKLKLRPYQREQARRMLADGQSQRAVARLLGVDHQSNSRSAPVSGALSFCSEILNVSTPSITPKLDANGRVGP
jgi:hypothetical protein